MRVIRGKCVVRKCENALRIKKDYVTKENDARKVTYHRFPKDKQKRQKWAAALQLRAENITDNQRVCSDHFLEEAFDRRLPCRVRLRENAIPFYLYKVNLDNDNHENDSKSQINHFSPEMSNVHVAMTVINVSAPNRCPSPTLNESKKEKLTIAKKEKKCDSNNKEYTDRATSVSPERIFNSPTKKRMRTHFQKKIKSEKMEKKRLSNKLRLVQMKMASMKKVIFELRKKELRAENQLKELEDIGKKLLGAKSHGNGS